MTKTTKTKKHLSVIWYVVWFQKISIPPPQRVIGNSKREGVLKAKIFKGKKV